jgi:hypothetical protein
MVVVHTRRVRFHVHHMTAALPASRPSVSRLKTVRGPPMVSPRGEAFDGRHPVVAPLVVIRSAILRAAGPGTGAGGVRAHDVGLGGDQLGRFFLGVDVLRGPDDGLADGHVEEILPADLLFLAGIDRPVCM